MTNTAQKNAQSAKNGKPEESAGEKAATKQQTQDPEPDRDNPVPSNYSNPDDGPAPSLNSILARLNSPADTDTNPLKGQEVKSLSDEDLLGLEMLNMVSLSAQSARPPFSASKIAELPEIINPEPVVAAPSPQVETELAEERPVEATVFPEQTETLEDAPKKAPSGKANNSAEAIYESAMAGDDSLFSVESAEESVEDVGEGNAMPFAEADSPVSAPVTSQNDDELGVTEEGQDAFVRSNIKGSNLEKLEALRQRLQGIFANQTSTQSNIPQNNPVAQHDEAESLTSPANDVQTDEEEMQTSSEISNPPENQLIVGNSPAQPATIHPVDEDLNTKGGVPMQTIDSTAATTGKQEKGGMMAGLATAAFLKDLNLEDEFSAPIQPGPTAPTTAPNQPMPSADAPEAVKPETAPAGDVDDYMKQLMNRLRGGSQSAPSQPASQVAASQAASASSSKSDAKAAAPEQPKEEVVPLKDGEFVPLSEAPGKNLDINALRELANQSTRSAINVFAKHQKKTLYATQLAAVCGGVIGAVIFGALASSLGSMFYLLSAGCVGISIFAGYKFFLANISSGQPARAK